MSTPSGWCFNTNRTTVLSSVHALQNCYIRMVLQNKSDNSTVHHALQSCQIRMVLQNKSDNSNGHALKWSNFRLNVSFWRCWSQKRTHFHENFLGNKNFRDNENFRETKFRGNLLIFEKTVFVSTLPETFLYMGGVSPLASIQGLNNV
jgi:hypothetical protein